jgi:anti-anti-sigma factor
MEGIGDRPGPAMVETASDATGTTIVSIAGDLDIASVPGLEAEIAPVLAAGPDRIAFNLSRVTFIDSSGIAMLLRVAERVAHIEIREPSASVRLIITATGLSEVLHTDL